MAKKAAKKTARKAAKKQAHKKPEATTSSSLRDNCEQCLTNDTMLKVIFVILGVAVVATSFYVGYLFGSGNGMNLDMGGSPSGKLVITEFSDFECPFCARFYSETYGQILAEYGDQVEFDFKQFPLSFHANAQKAAEASECARDQDMFWEYHDTLFETQRLDVASLKQHAADLGLDTAEFNNCLDSDEKAGVVAEHVAEGRAAGVSGTPSFIINGELLVGAQPFSVFQQAIDAALSGAAPAAPTPSPSPAPTPSAPVEVGVGTKPVMGDADAPVTIVEFLDYRCGFCGRHHTQTYPLIKENFIDQGLVRYAVRDFPVVGGDKAAEASRCAADQGQFEAYQDLLFTNQRADVAQYKAWAGQLGLNQGAFDSCLDSGEKADAVRADFADGQAAGITGTPGFFVNGVKISGAQPYNVFEAAINAALEG